MSRSSKQKRPMLTNEGFWGRLKYFVARAFLNIRQNALVNVLTIGTITLALLIVSLFLLVYVNLEGVAMVWSERVQVTAYFDKEHTPADVSQLKSRVQALVGTEKVNYVSKDEAFKRFRSRLKGQTTLIDGVTPEVLPASLEITLRKQYRENEALEAYVTRLKRVPGIAEVQYGEEWVKRFNSFMDFMRFVGAILGSFLLLAVLFIISNTIKLTIYSRRDELELMELVGATRLFIRAPFLVEGVVQGAIGALLALLILLLAYVTFLHNAGNFISFSAETSGLSFLPGEYLAGLLCGGICIGFLGSLISLKRFVNSQP